MFEGNIYICDLHTAAGSVAPTWETGVFPVTSVKSRRVQLRSLNRWNREATSESPDPPAGSVSASNRGKKAETVLQAEGIGLGLWFSTQTETGPTEP